MLTEIAWYDNVFAPPDQLKVSIEARGFLFGEGVYEMVLAFNGVLWGAEEHLDRLERSLDLMEMPLPMSRAEILALVKEAVSMIEAPVVGVYLQITRGVAPRSHSYLHLTGSKLMLIARIYDEHRDIYLSRGYAAITLPDIRWQHCDIKTLNLIPNTMAATQAERAGAELAIFVRDGKVTEGAAYNIYMVKDGAVYTSPLTDGILHGVTRQHLVAILAEQGIPLEEYFSVAEMLAADEVFATAASCHPAPIVRVDGQLIGDGRPGPMALRLDAAYEEKMAAVCGKRR